MIILLALIAPPSFADDADATDSGIVEQAQAAVEAADRLVLDVEELASLVRQLAVQRGVTLDEPEPVAVKSPSPK